MRKSKLTTLCTGYKKEGIAQLLMYVTDAEKEKDWVKLGEAKKNKKKLPLTLM